MMEEEKEFGFDPYEEDSLLEFDKDAVSFAL